MKQLMYQHIRLAGGKPGIISTVHFQNGKYETMVMDTEGEEVAISEDYTEKEAKAQYRRLLDYYHVPELKGKYKKLAEDLKAAMTYGQAHAGRDDGGTCNFDSPTIFLPRWTRKLVELAAKEAGCGCFMWDACKRYVFSVPGVGQGYTRTKAAEAAKAHLESLGYDAGMYYQMD